MGNAIKKCVIIPEDDYEDHRHRRNNSYHSSNSSNVSRNPAVSAMALSASHGSGFGF